MTLLGILLVALGPQDSILTKRGKFFGAAHA